MNSPVRSFWNASSLTLSDEQTLFCSQSNLMSLAAAGAALSSDIFINESAAASAWCVCNRQSTGTRVGLHAALGGTPQQLGFACVGPMLGLGSNDW